VSWPWCYSTGLTFWQWFIIHIQWIHHKTLCVCTSDKLCCWCWSKSPQWYSHRLIDEALGVPYISTNHVQMHG
jgi:hypothetical protein